MPSNPVPSLASFLTTSGKKLDTLMTNFAISNFSQSYVYQGNITSLPYIIAIAQYNKARLRSETKTAVTKYLNRFYDRVEITVEVEYIDKTTERVDLRLGGTVTDGDVNFDMAGLLRSEQGNFSIWESENNG